MVPNCRAYDPAYGYEVAVIVQDGLRRMFEEQEDCFYYLTLMDENYRHPAIFVTRCLSGRTGPVVAATDYIRAFGDQIRQWVPESYRVLGTDGFGRSDTRAALRRFFEADRHYVTLATPRELDPARAQEAIERYGIDPRAPMPTSV